MFLFCIFTQIPISLVKNIRILHKLSLYGTLALLYTVLVSVCEVPFYFKQNYSYEKLKLFDFNINGVKFLCMYFFAYTNHNAVLNVIHETQEPTKSKGNKIIKYAFVIEFVTYVIVLFAGYFSTFDDTKEIFIDRDDQSIFLLFGKVLYTVSLTCHIGLFYFISKPSIEMLFNKGNQFTEKEYINILKSILLEII
jgi:amino acid permease